MFHVVNFRKIYNYERSIMLDNNQTRPDLNDCFVFHLSDKLFRTSSAGFCFLVCMPYFRWNVRVRLVVSDWIRYVDLNLG